MTGDGMRVAIDTTGITGMSPVSTTATRARRRTRLVSEVEDGVKIPEDLFVDRDKIMPDMEMMVAGGKVYTANPIGVKVQGIIDHLRGYYNAKYRELRQVEEDREYNLAMTQWRNQLDQIHRNRHRGTVLVPPDMTNMPIMVYGANLCFLRYERYFPNEVTGPASYFRDRASRVGNAAKKIYEFANSIPGDKKLLMTIKQDIIDFEVLFAYSPKTALIYNPFIRTFHTMSSTKLCIGETPAKEFWESPIFSKMINRVNIYSPATDNFSFTDRNGRSQTVTLNHLFQDKFLVDIKKVEDEKWKV